MHVPQPPQVCSRQLEGTKVAVRQVLVTHLRFWHTNRLLVAMLIDDAPQRDHCVTSSLTLTDACELRNSRLPGA